MAGVTTRSAYRTPESVRSDGTHRRSSRPGWREVPLDVDEHVDRAERVVDVHLAARTERHGDQVRRDGPGREVQVGDARLHGAGGIDGQEARGAPVDLGDVQDHGNCCPRDRWVAPHAGDLDRPGRIRSDRCAGLVSRIRNGVDRNVVRKAARRDTTTPVSAKLEPSVVGRDHVHHARPAGSGGVVNVNESGVRLPIVIGYRREGHRRAGREVRSRRR